MTFFLRVACLGMLGLGIAHSAQAGTISLGQCPPQTMRCGQLGDALSGQAGTGNATVTDVNAYFGAGWTEVAERTSAGTTGALTVTVTSGSWGDKLVAGTWSIDPLLFPYLDLAISIHVGNGGSIEPDHYVFKIFEDGAPLTYSGTWSVNGANLAGGGLSNIKAYGRDPGTTTVPDGGVTLTLLGSALVGLGVLRRKLGA